MRRFVLGVLPLVVACSARQQNQASLSSGVPSPAPSTAVPAAGSIATANGERAEAPAQARPQEPTSVLELPAQEVFVRAPLPSPRPERYRSFVQTSRLMVGRSHLQTVDLFPGEAWLLAASDDEATVRVYERSTAKLVGNYPIAGFRRFETGGALAWPEAPPRFIVASVEGLFLYDAGTGGVLETLSRDALTGARWSPDRRVLVAREGQAQGATRLHFFERGAPAGSGRAPSSLRTLGVLEFPERVDAWDLSADNRLLATARYPSGDLVVTDLRTGSQVARMPGPDFGGDVAFSPDGRLVAMGGQGLLLVDLLNPVRRAFYSHFENNVGHVRFSPSGDAVVTSSYDGRLRVLHWEMAPHEGRTILRLSLMQTLRHDGQANVYAFVFEDGGDGIVSVSGDRTIRTFRAPKTSDAGANSREAPPRTFHALADWARLDPDAARPLPPAPEPSMRDGHYHPPILDGSPRPSRIQPGSYACKITLMYKLRDCRVWKDGKGHTLLEFHPDNLLALQGVLYDDGPVVRFEGWQTSASIVGDCWSCGKQALHAVFRGGPRRWQGLLRFREYYDPYTPPEPPAADEKIEEANDRFPLVLELRGASN